jgi:alpha-tubulin suppressor-like RCC1 family protein
VAVGISNTYFLTANGNLYSTGQNVNGKLGINSTSPLTANTPVYARGDIQSISAGVSQGYAITTNGTVLAWGDRTSLALGRNTVVDSIFPQPIVDTNNVIQGRAIKSIATATYSVLLLSSDGMLFSFGKNLYGQLGDGTTTDRFNPVSVIDGLNVFQGRTPSFIYMGFTHSLAIMNNGSIISWGDISGPGIGRTVNNRYPGLMDDPNNVISNRTFVGVAGGLSYSVMLTNDGKVFGVGDNQWGQLCTGTLVTTGTPVPVNASLNGVFFVKVKTTPGTTFLLSSNGTVYGCGYSNE